MTAMPELNWKDGQGFILVYSITSRESFEYLKAKRKEIETLTESNNVSAPIRILLNRFELPNLMLIFDLVPLSASRDKI